jgi:predicted permease
VVLSHRFWTEQFQNDPGVVGSAIRLGDSTFTVVGVARPEFHGNTILAPDLWMPSSADRPLGDALVGGRLKPEVPLSKARAEMDAIARTLSADRLFARQAGLVTRLRVDRSTPVPYGIRIVVVGFFSLLTAIVLMVLTVACANVAGLLLARGSSRDRETAVRVAVGVSRPRLVRQLLTETIVLFVAGGLGGLLLSRIMAVAILRLLPALPLPSDPALLLDGHVVIFALGVSLVAALTFGLARAVRTARVDVLSLLKSQEQGSATAVRLRRAFVVAQIALSIVLVIVSALLTRTLAHGAAVEGAFDAHGVDVVSIDLGTAQYTPITGRLFMADLERKLRSLPDLQAVAIASGTPIGGAMGFQIGVPGIITPDVGQTVDVLGNVITAGYFATLRIPMLAGRDFAETDTDTAVRAVIVTEKTVRRFWPSLRPQEAIGRQLLLTPWFVAGGNPRRPPTLTPMTIVGVVADVRSDATWRPYMYLPIQQQYAAAIRILARARDDQRAVPRIREQLLAMDGRLPVLKAGALEDESNPVTIQLRISAAIAGSLGITGVLLATIGVYGVTSYMVARRTREIGIRVALGADRAAVVRMAMGEAAGLLAVGVFTGLLVAAAAARALRGLQFGIIAADPVAFIGAVLIFAVVGCAASYLPVRRALAIDPSRALRYE